MNSYNHVFQAIKNLADKDGKISGEQIFKDISLESDIIHERIEKLLENLEVAQFIKIGSDKKSIQLTQKGLENNSIFDF